MYKYIISCFRSKNFRSKKCESCFNDKYRDGYRKLWIDSIKN